MRRKFIPITKETLLKPTVAECDLAKEDKIKAIKMYRDRVGVGLLAAKTAIEWFLDGDKVFDQLDALGKKKFKSADEQYQDEIQRLDEQIDKDRKYYEERLEDVLRGRDANNKMLKEDNEALHDLNLELLEFVRNYNKLLHKAMELGVEEIFGF